MCSLTGRHLQRRPPFCAYLCEPFFWPKLATSLTPLPSLTLKRASASCLTRDVPPHLADILFSPHQPWCPRRKCPLVPWSCRLLLCQTWSIYHFLSLRSAPIFLSLPYECFTSQCKASQNYHPPPCKSKLHLPTLTLHFFLLIHSLILSILVYFQHSGENW